MRSDGLLARLERTSPPEYLHEAPRIGPVRGLPLDFLAPPLGLPWHPPGFSVKARGVGVEGLFSGLAQVQQLEDPRERQDAYLGATVGGPTIA